MCVWIESESWGDREREGSEFCRVFGHLAVGTAGQSTGVVQRMLMWGPQGGRGGK